MRFAYLAAAALIAVAGFAVLGAGLAVAEPAQAMSLDFDDM